VGVAGADGVDGVPGVPGGVAIGGVLGSEEVGVDGSMMGVVGVSYPGVLGGVGSSSIEIYLEREKDTLDDRNRKRKKDPRKRKRESFSSYFGPS